MLQVIWRVEALALPALLLACARCARSSSFVCTERFRVNANGGRLDVWLLYQCLDCAEVHKERVVRRARVVEVSPKLLDGYQVDEPTLVRQCAFASGRGAEVPFRVERPSLPASGLLRARIEQPEPCGARWDRLLASELGWSRAQVARAAEQGRLRVNGAGGLRRAVADGDDLEAALGAAPSG